MRSTKKSEGEFLQEMIEETKKELSSKVQHVKVTAVQTIMSLSAAGSSTAPIALCWLKCRARNPSRTSLTAAPTKTASAVPYISPRSR